MKIHDCIQGSESWFDIKRGLISASRFSDVLNKGTGRSLYMRKLAAERLTGLTEETYSNKNMENGIDNEAAAKEFYELLNDCPVDQVGFIERNEWVGCSPDGLVGTDGGIEIKSVIASTHINTIDKDKMPTTYIPQVQGAIWVSDRKWWDWVEYCPTMTVRPFYCTRIFRDEPYIAKLEVACDRFIDELKTLISKITGE